ncbi:MAG: hypothetical protein O7F08_03640 [Deltaproteobacteria bacterium]|nr:hypothetical protein [Deltaproteobacteria bacterium]
MIRRIVVEGITDGDGRVLLPPDQVDPGVRAYRDSASFLVFQGGKLLGFE